MLNDGDESILTFKILILACTTKQGFEVSVLNLGDIKKTQHIYRYLCAHI